ncbi:MAG: YitT family protein [Clostridia bacterium]|nr:YitT family protein [Clostridia bacterium]
MSTQGNKTASKNSARGQLNIIFKDILVCFISAILVSGSLYYFSNYNRFAPGGVTGFASIIGSLISDAGIGDVTLNMSILMLTFNVPIFIMVALLTSRKTGVMLLVYLAFQTLLLMLFKYLHTAIDLPYYGAFPSSGGYAEGNNVVFAAIGVGVISGLGFSIMLRRFGASGGTYAISALIKHFKPEKNIAWLAFVLDSSVVVLAFFVYDSSVNSVISTLTNIFISDLVVDYMLQGLRSGYKFEIITEHPDELAQELMQRLHRGVTLLHAEGMYTHSDKSLLICIVRKREVGEFLKLLKKHSATFSYSCRVNEVYGNFKMKVGDTASTTIETEIEINNK